MSELPLSHPVASWAFSPKMSFLPYPVALALLTRGTPGAVLQKLFQTEPEAEICSSTSDLPPELHLHLEDAERAWKGAWELGKPGPAQP